MFEKGRKWFPPFISIQRKEAHEALTRQLSTCRVATRYKWFAIVSIPPVRLWEAAVGANPTGLPMGKGADARLSTKQTAKCRRRDNARCIRSSGFPLPLHRLGRSGSAPCSKPSRCCGGGAAACRQAASRRLSAARNSGLCCLFFSSLAKVRRFSRPGKKGVKRQCVLQQGCIIARRALRFVRRGQVPPP